MKKLGYTEDMEKAVIQGRLEDGVDMKNYVIQGRY